MSTTARRRLPGGLEDRDDYFRCKIGDDPVNAWAFNRRATRMSSHMFINAVRFWGEVNPDFFEGTAVEKQAAETLARSASVPAAR